MKLGIPAFAMAVTLFATPLFAAIQTVTLSVPGMFCASCPFIVEAAMGDVQGVQSVETNLDERIAIVTFDDEITTIDDIAFASTVVGYDAFSVEADTGS